MSVAVVAPAYLKSFSLAPFLLQLQGCLDTSKHEYQVIIVVDGDIDNSSKVLEALSEDNPRLKFIVHPKNLGKGAAIRTGVAAVQDVDYIAYLDADLDIDPEALVAYLDFLDRNSGTDILYGSKTHNQSIVNYPAIRTFVSQVLQLLVRALLRIKIQDTQTGLKVGRSKAMKEAVLNTDTNGFAFDLEFFVIADAAGYIVAPMPVKINFQFTSTVNLVHAFHVFADLLRITYWSRSRKKFRKSEPR